MSNRKKTESNFTTLSNGLFKLIKTSFISIGIFASILYLPCITILNISKTLFWDFDTYLIFIYIFTIIAFICGSLAFTSQVFNKPAWTTYTFYYKKTYCVFLLISLLINIVGLSINDRIVLAKIDVSKLLLYSWLLFFITLVLCLILKYLFTCVLIRKNLRIRLLLHTSKNSEAFTHSNDIFPIAFLTNAPTFTICLLIICVFILFITSVQHFFPIISDYAAHILFRFTFLFNIAVMMILVYNTLKAGHQSATLLENSIDTIPDKDSKNTINSSIEDIIRNKIQKTYKSVDDDNEASNRIITWLQELVQLLGPENIPTDYLNVIEEHSAQKNDEDN